MARAIMAKNSLVLAPPLPRDRTHSVTVIPCKTIHSGVKNTLDAIALAFGTAVDLLHQVSCCPI